MVALYAPYVLSAIEAPKAPPELGEYLLDYRTKEQLKENVLKNDTKSDLDLTTDIPSPVVVPGDEESGILRLSYSYIPNEQIAIPQYGTTILRFYDSDSYPWDIKNIKLENQGFMATTTANTSELIIKQLQGASNTTLVVNLQDYQEPLIFMLRPLSLINKDKRVKTIIESIKVNDIREGSNLVKAPLIKFAKPNPNAQKFTFDEDTFESNEMVLVDSLLELKELK